MSIPTRSATRQPGPSRGRWPARDYPAVVWLILAVVVALTHPWVPEATWLMVHLVLLGALTHAVMVWSTYFSQTLLKTAETESRRRQSVRAMVLAAGVTIVLAGVPSGFWQVALAGAVVVAGAIVWHGLALWQRLRSALPGRFRVTIRHYLLAACCLPIGATFGVLLARGPSDPWHGRLLVAHTMTMALGWIGLTVTGTLVTLWPTMLRTRMDDRAERMAGQSMPIFAVSLVVAVAAALAGSQTVTALGLAGYLAGLIWWGRSLVLPARTKPPKEFCTGSVGSALLWFLIALTWVIVVVATSATWAEVVDQYGSVAALITVGFGAQILAGALSYLVPVVLGGGPRTVRIVHLAFDRGATWRLVLSNAGVAALVLPLPSLVRVLVTGLGFIALVSFLVVFAGGIVAFVRARNETADPATARTSPQPSDVGTGWKSGQFVAALTALVLVVAVGVGVDRTPSAATPEQTAVQATGHTTEVTVHAKDMRFSPSNIEVPYGDRLLITVVNDDPTTVHDLVLDTGVGSKRLRPGQSDTIDAGVVAADIAGWCSLVGHRQQGMTLAITVTGGPAGAGGAGHSGAHQGGGTTMATTPVADGDFAAGHVAFDPVLPPLTDDTTHVLTWHIKDVDIEVAPGVWQRRWTYNGQSPGPTLHGRVGDRFVVTIVNDGTMGHSIDFHASRVAPDQAMRTVPPGESLTYEFTAEHSGIWLYHCSTVPMSAHMAAGMVGAVVIEPPGLPAVERSYLLVQSEIYLGADTGKKNPSEVDADKVTAGLADAVVFNGAAFQYHHDPLTAKVGERVRIWVLDAGPNRPFSFHVVGTQFDTVYAEGSYLLRPETAGTGGSQALSLGAAQGGFVEMTFPEPGHYSIVNHVMSDAERGAHGIVAVSE